MYGYKRARLDLDSDTHECMRYFALLRGVPVGGALRQIIARHATAIEAEFPPVRAHMLAWRAAMDSAKTSAPSMDSGPIEVDEVPF